MAMTDPLELLAQTSLFRGMAPESLRALAQICVPKQVVRKTMLFAEGQRGEAMFVLAWGSIRLQRTMADGRQVVIKVIRPGEIFAEVILFESPCYPVDAEALQDSLLFLLPRRQVRCLLDQTSFRDDFITMMLRRQRELVNRIQLMSVSGVQERLFVFLRQQYGERETFEADLSKKDVAGAIGTTPETLSRLLLRLREDAVLIWEGRQVRLQPGFWQHWKVEE